jgi:hypothetical protein
MKIKICAVFFILALCLKADAQVDSVFKLEHTNKYKRITLNIIRYLGIPFRNSYFKDGPLMFAFDKPPGFHERSPAYGMFVRGTYFFRKPDTINVFYPAPVVYISRNIYHDLQNKRHSYDKFVRALGCVLHEITHYYQHINYNYVSYWPSGDYHAYFCQPYERDAYAVEAFFYLSKLKPRILQKTLATHAGDNDGLKLQLIKLHSQYIKRPVVSDLMPLDCQ